MYNEIFENINKKQSKTNPANFDVKEFAKTINFDDDIQNKTSQEDNFFNGIDNNRSPKRKSYYVAKFGKEINTTAQTAREIEFEADTTDNPKEKDKYFALTKLGGKTKTGIIKSALENALKYNPLAIGVIAKNKINEATDKNDIEIAGEAVRGFVAGTVDFVSSLYRLAKQNIDTAKTYTKEQLDKIANVGNVVAGGESLSTEIAQKYTNFYNKIDEQNKILKNKTEKFLQYSGLAKNDKDGFIYDLASGGASLLYSLGLFAITKNPATVASFFGAYQYQGLYEEGIERGFSPIKARTIGAVGGIIEAGLETVGLHLLVDTLKARGSFGKIIKAFITEATQEASQQAAEETLARVAELRDTQTKQIAENVFYAGLIGGILGGGSATVSNLFYKQISNNATQALIEKGVKEEYAKQMVNNVLQLSISDYGAKEIQDIIRDEQSPVTYKNSDPRETYKETGEEIRKALNPEQKRGIELEFIEAKKKLTDDVARILINSGKFNEETAYRQAEAKAALADSLARTAFEQENIRPEEYYKRFHVNVNSGNIEADERNIDENNITMDTSFDPADFDEEVRKQYEDMADAEQEYIDSLQKENKSTLKKEARIMGEMGIGAIRRPTPDGYGKERWTEYNDLSPRIKKYFFTDDENAMKWDEAEDLLQEDLFEYLTKVDARAETYNQANINKTKIRADKNNYMFKIVAKDLIEARTVEEIEDKLQKIFGSYEQLQADEMSDDIDKMMYVLANKYMANLEYAARQRDYIETEALLNSLKKDVLDISEMKGYNIVDEKQKEIDQQINSLDLFAAARADLLGTESASEGNSSASSSGTGNVQTKVKDFSIQQLIHINDSIVECLYTQIKKNENPFYDGLTKNAVEFVKANGIKNVSDIGIYVESKDKERFYSDDEIEEKIERLKYLKHEDEVKEFEKLLNLFNKTKKKFIDLQEQLRAYIADNMSVYKQNIPNQNNPRGTTTVYDRQYYIDLFSTADKSTLLHEMAHAYLSEILYFAKMKNTTQKVLDIKKQLDNFLGEPENNGRYSTKQQEKFATSFEAYLKEGKAPTARLRNVFEKFAQWLASIYDGIKDSLPKINEETKKLFDTILERSYDVPDSNIYAGKTEAIKKVIENINNGIASEVDGITIEDVYKLMNVAYTRKPSKPNKNLQKLLKEKDIYDFNDLAKTDDKKVLEIMKQGGYIDDKTTIEQARELAKKALDGNIVYKISDQWRLKGDADFTRNLRILEKVLDNDFGKVDSIKEKILELEQQGYRQVEQQDIDKTKNEYKRLFSADVKEAKKIVADVIERIKRKKFIDRAAQKQMLNDLNFSDTVEEIKESVLDVIDELQDEMKLIKEQLKKPRKPIIKKDKTVVPGKNATKEEIDNYKKYMRRQINRLLKLALPRKQNQNKFAKFDVETQRFFDDLQRINKLNMEEAQAELYKNATGIIDDDGVGVDNFIKIKNMFLSYKSNKVTGNSAEFYKQLYDNLQEINVMGRNVKDIQDSLRKEKMQEDIDKLIYNIDTHKGDTTKQAVKKNYIKWLGNWWSTINAIAGKEQADKDSLEKIEIDIFNKNYETSEAVKNKCKEALGLKNSTDLDMTVNRYLKEEYIYGEKDPRSKRSHDVKLNKMQIICCYIWCKNQTLKDRIVRAYGNAQLDDMMSKLTIQDKKFGDVLQESVAGMYDDINRVYLKMYGLDLHQAENYFPSTPERIQGNMDLLKDNIGQASSPGFIKSRVDSNLPLMNFGNPVKIALSHIQKANHFIMMQEKLADLNKVYKTTIVKRNITNLYGENVYKYILQVLDNSKFTNVARTVDGISDLGDYLTNNYVLTRIALKPSITIKQLLSCVNYIEDIKVTEWMSGFVDGILHPKETIKFMMDNSKYCKSRFAKGGQNEALLKAVEAKKEMFARVTTFKDILSFMTRVGDIGAIIFGGYPMVKAQIKKGVLQNKAFENFELATIRSQQASLPSTLSNWQYRGMDSWLYRAMFAFANTPSQYCRKIGDSMYMYWHGDIDKKQLAKNIVIYGAINSILYTSFTSLAILSGLVSGDWDDLKDDIIMSLMQCSNLLSLPIIGQAYNSFVARVVTGEFLPDKEIPLLSDFIKIIKTLNKDELEFNDWLTVTDEATSLATGVPAKTLYTELISSTKDLLNGEYGKWLVKLYGATENRAEKIFD